MSKVDMVSRNIKATHVGKVKSNLPKYGYCPAGAKREQQFRLRSPHGFEGHIVYLAQYIYNSCYGAPIGSPMYKDILNGRTILPKWLEWVEKITPNTLELEDE